MLILRRLGNSYPFINVEIVTFLLSKIRVFSDREGVGVLKRWNYNVWEVYRLQGCKGKRWKQPIRETNTPPPYTRLSRLGELGGIEKYIIGNFEIQTAISNVFNHYLLRTII